MSSRGFTPPPDETNEVAPPEAGDHEGEPDTKDDEMARDDAPEQEWEEEEA